MEKLSNTEVELKNSVAYKKGCYLYRCLLFSNSTSKENHLIYLFITPTPDCEIKISNHIVTVVGVAELRSISFLIRLFKYRLIGLLNITGL